MIIIVGLGNPGLKYKRTRHNIGFRVLDEFHKESNFPKFKLDKKSKSEISKGIVNGKEVLLAKPQTFMNNSGLAVKELGSFQCKEPSSFQLVVAHDDFDLDFGEVKISENIGSGGHHGVQSIIDSLKTQKFKRFRIGVRPISSPEHQKLKAEDFVLKKFTKEEEKIVKQVLKKSCQALKVAITEGIEKAMSEVNKEIKRLS